MKLTLWLVPVLASAQGMHVGTFAQEMRTVLFAGEDVRRVSVSASGEMCAELGDKRCPPSVKGKGLRYAVRQVAVARDGRMAAAAAEGLFVRSKGAAWSRVFPQDGARSWAPVDVRGVAFDAKDRMWFASPQGVGVLDGARWRLFTGAEGLPCNDFTTVAAGGDGAVWFGTHAGAIRYDGEAWEYRQGLRWLPDDDVQSIAVGAGGDAWIATKKGLAHIERRPMTLAEKARVFEEEIDKRHRRTPYGFVLEVALARPGDTSEWTQHDSDNDGLWTAMYGAGECFAAAATKSEDAYRRATAVFEALRFLGTVTQGGEHPAPAGFVARTVVPADGPDPNRRDGPDRDARMQATRDRLWKTMPVRWPLSGDGQWYWKSDTSSDELDGHYFFYGLYYDLAARTDDEKRRVREQVAGLTDHLIEHEYRLVDHDGRPTRWGIFDPANLNQNMEWWEERGINSLSILTYLKVAAHVTGDAKYERHYRTLVEQHSYAENVLIPKSNGGPGSGNQSDDEMIFMNFYGLLRYERDPVLRTNYLVAFRNAWRMEAPEMNPLFHFLYAATAGSEKYSDAFSTVSLAPDGGWLEDSVDTLRRFPIDRVEWGYRNSGRLDLVRLEEGRGYRVNGKVVPVDERFVNHWNLDPWRFDGGGGGRSLGDGAVFLLPYWLGRWTGFLEE